jgi:hypothetical protein
VRYFATALLVLSCCGSEEPRDDLPLCRLSDAPELSVGHGVWTFGAIPATADLAYADAPQGGPPFSEFRFRAVGLDAGLAPLRVSMETRRTTDDTVVGAADYEQKFLCANTGADRGTLQGPALHMRFPDTVSDGLDGAGVRMTFVFEDAAGRRAETSVEGVLVYTGF